MSRVFNLSELRSNHKDKIISVSFSCWDLLNPDDIMLLQYIKSNSEILCVGIHKNTVLYNPENYYPIQKLEDRITMIESCRYVDYYFIYDTELTLYNCIKDLEPNMCFLDNNYKNSSIMSLPIKYVYHPYYNHIESLKTIRNKIYIRETYKIN